MVITVSHAGYIKRTPVDIYRISRGAAKGGSAQKRARRISSKNSSLLHHTISCCSLPRDRLWLKVYEIPKPRRSSRQSPNQPRAVSRGEKLTPWWPLEIWKRKAATFFSPRVMAQ